MLDSITLAEKLYALNQAGELSRALERNKLEVLLVYRRGVDVTSGLRRWLLLGYQYNRLANVYRELGLGELGDYMWGCEYDNIRGTALFLAGDEYSSFDTYLLGGNGNGYVQRAFEEAGLSIV